jgi:Protein of unknown function (DUF2934)
MAKKPPRTEADDTNTASANREARSSGAALAHDSSEYAPTEEEIRYRAYLLYIERGGGHGLDFEDWLQAERELKHRSR